MNEHDARTELSDQKDDWEKRMAALLREGVSSALNRCNGDFDKAKAAIVHDVQALPGPTELKPLLQNAILLALHDLKKQARTMRAADVKLDGGK